MQTYIAGHLHETPSKIALKKSPFSDVTSRELAEQIDSKQRSEKKLPLWFCTPGIYYPPKLSIEQASSEATGNYKSKLATGTKLIDLTGGFGVDSFYFAQHSLVTHVETNEELSAIAKHNAEKLGATDIKFIHGDGIDYLRETNETFDTIYIDPSRRVKTQKVFRLSDCQPDAAASLPFLLSKAPRIIIKTSSLLDIKSGLNELQNVSEIHVVSVQNDCKELLWIIDRDFAGEPLIICTALGEKCKQYHFRLSEEKSISVPNYSDPETYIYEPDVALLKAGCFKLLTRDFGISKLHTNTHLYTSNELRDEFVGRKFRLLEAWDFKTYQSAAPVTKANIICRNFPLSPEDLKKKYKIKDGGNDYLVFTTGPDKNLLVLHCKRL